MSKFRHIAIASMGPEDTGEFKTWKLTCLGVDRKACDIISTPLLSTLEGRDKGCEKVGFYKHGSYFYCRKCHKKIQKGARPNGVEPL